MLIRLGYDIQFDVPVPVPMVALLNTHPSRAAWLREPDLLQVAPRVPVEQYIDSFGNICQRFVAPAGPLQLLNSFLVEAPDTPDEVNWNAHEVPVGDLPAEVLPFLLASRYCEVDLMTAIAAELFGHISPGWNRVQAICNWVHTKVEFGYPYARPTKTALDVYTERRGVCRDYQHLAIAFCRCLNIPARYATGYLGDFRVPPQPPPMDFSAWFEVFLEDRWWTFDARFNQSRYGRVLMATGRDAVDVAITTSFGSTRLTKFLVVADEVLEEAAGGQAKMETGVTSFASTD